MFQTLMSIVDWIVKVGLYAFYFTNVYSGIPITQSWHREVL